MPEGGGPSDASSSGLDIGVFGGSNALASMLASAGVFVQHGVSARAGGRGMSAARSLFTDCGTSPAIAKEAHAHDQADRQRIGSRGAGVDGGHDCLLRDDA